MRLNPCEIDLSEEEQSILNTADDFSKKINYEDIRISKELPIVIKYDYIDLDKTKYNFKQQFQQCDTSAYFTMMKKISSNTINELERKSRTEYHFYRSPIVGRIKEVVDRVFKKYDNDLIIYHFALYTNKKGNANRKDDVRSPRIYFALGTNGFIYPLFFDPYHELNP